MGLHIDAHTYAHTYAVDCGWTAFWRCHEIQNTVYFSEPLCFCVFFLSKKQAGETVRAEPGFRLFASCLVCVSTGQGGVTTFPGQPGSLEEEPVPSTSLIFSSSFSKCFSIGCGVWGVAAH